MLSVDKPLTNPGDDRLGYSSFAKKIAQAIGTNPERDGLVLALYGPWGSGKTTVLNFIEHFLHESPLQVRTKSLWGRLRNWLAGERPEQPPIVVRLNPWVFSGSEDLIGQFFGQLVLELAKSKHVSRQVLNSIGELGSIVATVPVPYSGTIGKLLRAVSGRRRSLATQRKEVAEILRKSPTPITVLIDDIDRLTADEIRQTFGMVKAVADLPNVIYFMALDRTVVVSALDNAHPGFGASYLEKVVQVPFELPLPSKASIRALFLDRLQELFDRLPDNELDQRYWSNVFFDGIDPFLVSVRQVKRLTNTIAVTLPLVAEEVNLVDFVAVETLRVFASDVYNFLRRNPEFFVGGSPSSDSRREEASTAITSMLDAIDTVETRRTVDQLLSRLFPRYEGQKRNVTYMEEQWATTWRRAKRVCSRDRFPIYFRLSLPEGEISSSEVQELVALFSDRAALSRRLLRDADQVTEQGTSRARSVLAALEDHLDDLPRNSAQSLLTSLFGIGDQLVRADPESGPMSYGMATQIGRVIVLVLRALPENARFALLRQAVSESTALFTVVREVAVLAPADEDSSSHRLNLLADDERLELRALALERIRQFAADEMLFESHGLPTILSCWADWGDPSEPVEWLSRQLREPGSLIPFLRQCQSTSQSWGASDRVATSSKFFDIQAISRLHDPGEWLSLAREEIGKPELDSEDRALLKSFIDAVENWSPRDE